MTESTSPTPERGDHPQPTLLVGGVNFTTWPDLKWSRACSHIAALESSLQEWHASAPISVEGVLREDRKGLNFVARVPRGIPKHEWALDLGDALHNFRSAFDAVAWGMAHFKDAFPKRPKRVIFPIFNEESKWNDAVREWIGDLLPEFQARLRLVQPFNYTSDAPDLLTALHDLDIQDKHRDMLLVSANLNHLSFNGAAFEYVDPEAETKVQLEMYEGVTFADGAVLGTLHAGSAVEAVDRMILRPSMQVQLSYGGQTYDAVTLLRQFRDETRRYLDILLGGWTTEEEGDGGWLPMDLETSPPPTGSPSD